MTGLLIFLIVKTHPDITFSTSITSHFAKNLSYQHTKAVKTMFKYLKKTKIWDIIYNGKEDLKILGYLDSN